MLSKHHSIQRDQLEMITIDQLVPANHLVRKMEVSIDFTFIYDLVVLVNPYQSTFPCFLNNSFPFNMICGRKQSINRKYGKTNRSITVFRFHTFFMDTKRLKGT